MSENLPEAAQGEFVLFRNEDGQTHVECRFESDTLWLSQASICEHISNIFTKDELAEDSVVRFYRTTADDGKQHNVKYFNLSMILAVGYRVRSVRVTQFRQWATQTLEQYLIKGFVMDDERLKDPPIGQSVVLDCFDEMLERIRDIRASERRVYLRVKEIFTMAVDYEPSNKETNRFFQIIQNKLHFACTGMTAAELKVR